MTPAWEGILLIDKPAGPTSHDVVAHVRRALGGVRAGHTGTLDPPATGLLVVALGAATRLVRFLPAAPKSYAGTFVLGLSTTTDDLAGDVLRRHAGPLPAPEEIVSVARQFVGAQRQVAPSVSAKSVGGRRLHELARRGQSVAAPVSDVVVERFAVTPTDRSEIWGYEMTASEGTYVRGIVRDLGSALGCEAAVATLRRTAIGPWNVGDALALEPLDDSLPALAAAHLAPIDALPLTIPSVVLQDVEECNRFRRGAQLSRRDRLPALASAVAIRSPEGVLLGVGRVEGDRLQPDVVLAPRSGTAP